MNIDKSRPVLVTGANGYVAGRLVEKLLQEGITVHAAVRDPENRAKTEPLIKLAESLPGKLLFFKADLLDEGSYTEAAQGCQVIFHTASPFIRNVKNTYSELIQPALEGTRNVLETANKVESVERVVLTSSCAAIYGDAFDLMNIPGHTLSEEIWNTSSNEKHQAYSYSKTRAEQEAWKINKAQNRWRLVTINPSLVIGPGINKQGTSDSFSIFKQIGNGDLKMGIPNFNLGCVDVRDVAEAHFKAGFMENANGRYIISGHDTSFFDLARIVKNNFPKTPIRLAYIPKWVIWLIAPMIGLTRKEVKLNVGYPWHASNRKSIEELEMHYLPLEESVTSFFQFLLEGGHIKN